MGVGINVPLYVIAGAIILALASIIPVVVLMCRPNSSVAPDIINNIAEPTSDVYSDKLIKITADSIIFYKYHFPFGNKKTVELSKIDYIKIIKGSNLRLWGSDDFRTWFPADWSRMSRDRMFIVYLKSKWSRIGFTVEDSSEVLAVLNNKGLLCPDACQNNS